MLLYSRQCADKSESDLLFSEASSTGEAGEERFVSLLVCREQPGRTKTPVITVNLRKGSMAANQSTNQPAAIQRLPNNGNETSKLEGAQSGRFPSPKSTRPQQKVNM